MTHVSRVLQGSLHSLQDALISMSVFADLMLTHKQCLHRILVSKSEIRLFAMLDTQGIHWRSAQYVRLGSINQVLVLVRACLAAKIFSLLLLERHLQAIAAAEEEITLQEQDHLVVSRNVIRVFFWILSFPFRLCMQRIFIFEEKLVGNDV